MKFAVPTKLTLVLFSAALLASCAPATIREKIEYGDREIRLAAIKAAPHDFEEQDAQGKKDLIKTLHEALQDTADPRVKIASAWALGQIGPPAAEAIPELIEIIKYYVLPAVVSFPQSFAPVAGGVAGPGAGTDPAGGAGARVAQQLAQARTASMRQKAFSKYVATGTIATDAQEQATLALANMGLTAVPALLELLKDPTIMSITRRYAVSALGIIGAPAASDAVPYLSLAIRNDDREIRSSAVQALTVMGPSARAAIPVLIQDLRENDAEIYYHVIDALAAMKYDAVQPLIETLRGKDATLRIGATKALAALGTLAIPALMLSLEEGDAQEKYHAGRALESAGPDPFKALLRALKDPNPAKRADALFALNLLGPKAVRAVPDLITALKDESQYVRRNAALVLGNLGAAALPAVPELIRLLKDPDTLVNESAATALKNIGAPEGVKAVEENRKVVP